MLKTGSSSSKGLTDPLVGKREMLVVVAAAVVVAVVVGSHVGVADEEAVVHLADVVRLLDGVVRSPHDRDPRRRPTRG